MHVNIFPCLQIKVFSTTGGKKMPIGTKYHRNSILNTLIYFYITM